MGEQRRRTERLGDAPIESAHAEQMNKIAAVLEQAALALSDTPDTASIEARAMEQAAEIASEELAAIGDDGGEAEVWVVRRIVDSLMAEAAAIRAALDQEKGMGGGHG